MTVATIVLNWNGKRYLQDCLPDLIAQNYLAHRVVVVDNGSRDGSQYWIRGNFPQVELIETFSNVGFAEGNNVGIRRALEYPEVRYLALVNNDTRIPKDWISTLVSALDRNPEYGAAQGPLVFNDDPFTINSLGIALEPSLWAFDDGCMEKDPSRFQAGEIFGVTAGAAIFRREMVEDLLVDGALFEPRFFAYYEDVDLALRARLKGWKCLFVPGAVVRHVGSATAGREVHRKVFLLERNHWFYVIRNIPLSVFLLKTPGFLKKRAVRITQWARERNWRCLAWSIRGNLVWVLSILWLIRTRRQNLRIGDRDSLVGALDLKLGNSERSRV